MRAHAARALLAALALTAALAQPAQAFAQSQTPPREQPPRQPAPRTPPPRTPIPAARLDALERRAAELFAQGDLAGSEKVLREQLALDPEAPVVLMNLAINQGAQTLRAQALGGGDADKAPASLDFLRRAIDAGFDDLRRIERDPLLAPARAQPAYPDLVRDWPAVLNRQGEARLEAARRIFTRPQSATLTRDDALRIYYLNSFDEASFARARAELDAIAIWAQAEIFTAPPADDAPPASAPAATGASGASGASGGAAPPPRELTPWVVVALPPRADFQRWIARTLGPARTAFFAVGGGYFHDTKTLTAQDLGSTLRHEFLHILHWRDMSARPVPRAQPLWLQEGLCALVEDVRIIAAPGHDNAAAPDDPARVIPLPSWRTNTVKRLASMRRALTPHQIVALDDDEFRGGRSGRPLAMYAQARTLFLFLHERRALRAFYHAFADEWHAPRTPAPVGADAGTPRPPTRESAADIGARALERALNADAETITRDYLAFVRSLPDVNEQVPTGGASLGVEVDVGEGDGPVITRVVGSEARRANLRPGDTILFLEGQPVRDTPDLVRILTDLRPGRRAEIIVRRGRVEATLFVTLEARPPEDAPGGDAPAPGGDPPPDPPPR